MSNWLDNYLDNSHLKNKCTIYLYGLAGVGKTSLCESFGATGTGASQTSTNDIQYHTFQKILGSKSLNVAVLDYPGQKHYLVTVYLPEQYAGRKRNRIINAAIFIVDIVGRRDYTGAILDTTERQLAWLQDDTEQKINQRIKEHTTYINGSLEIVLASIFSLNLRSIRLVINKFDLIQELLKSEHIVNHNNLNYVDFAKQLFEEITIEIEKACGDNNIRDFQVEVISAKNDYNTRKLLDGILNSYDDFVQTR